MNLGPYNCYPTAMYAVFLAMRGETQVRHMDNMSKLIWDVYCESEGDKFLAIRKVFVARKFGHTEKDVRRLFQLRPVYYGSPTWLKSFLMGRAVWPCVEQTSKARMIAASNFSCLVPF